MKRKQRLTIFDIGRLPVTPVAQPTGDAIPAGTLKQYREREQAREKQEAATRQAEIERVQKDTSRLMAECLSVSAPLQSKFWGQQSFESIKAHLLDDDVFDNLFLPTSEESVDKTTFYDIIQQFLDGVVFEQGFSLGDTSRRRFGLYVASQVNAGVIVNPASLKVMFDRCFSLGIFKDDGDSEFVEHFRAETPIKQPRVEPVEVAPRRVTYEDLENIDESTRAGRREANRIADALYLEQMTPIVRAWVKNVHDTFGYDITMDDLKHVDNWMNGNSKSWVDHRSFNECRRALVSQGIFPASCLTNVERLNREMETMNVSEMPFEERRALRIREKMAIEADMKQFGRL